MKLILSDTPLHGIDQQGTDIRYFDLSACKIAHCVGCFGCWTKTPGKCVIRDDAVKVYPCIAQSDKLLYVSRIKYGGYDSIMKTMLERAIPVQQAFIRILDGETHHVQRAVVPKQATIIAYGETSDEEQTLFRQLVDRNARNMSFAHHEIRFVSENMLQDAVKEEVQKWQTS